MLWGTDNHIYMCHVQKDFLTKISNFHNIAQNLTYSQKSYFFKYKEVDQLLLPYEFNSRDM